MSKSLPAPLDEMATKLGVLFLIIVADVFAGLAGREQQQSVNAVNVHAIAAIAVTAYACVALYNFAVSIPFSSMSRDCALIATICSCVTAVFGGYAVGSSESQSHCWIHLGMTVCAVLIVNVIIRDELVLAAEKRAVSV